MTDTKLHPFVILERGRRGNKVLYPNGDKQCVRTYVKPANPKTIMQQQKRSKFASAVKAWQSLNPESRLKYAGKAKNLNMSGYNLFLSGYILSALNKMRRQNSTHGNRFSNHSGYVMDLIHSVSTPFLSLSLMIALLGTVNTSPKYG